MSGISDSFQRPIDYLRISVTDRCNLRCVYCMPPGGITLREKDELLTFEEIARVAGAAAGIGISKIRLTGGEPLVRAGLAGLVKAISAIKGIDDIAMTTNAVLLKDNVLALKEAGLRRVNISVDTLKPERFKTICGFDGLQRVLEGHQAARSAGLDPVKVNMVVMRGVNDDEVVDFARKSITDGWNVRYIELMPISPGGGPQESNCSGGPGNGARDAGKFVSTREIKERLNMLGKFLPYKKVPGNGPARYFRFPGATGSIGFISPVSEHICVGCNRLRLTADGKLRPCLLSDEEIDLRQALRAGASTADVEAVLRRAIAAKPVGNQLKRGIVPRKRSMSQIGG